MRIQSDHWKIEFFEEDAFVRRFGEGIAGLCNTAQRKIYFHDGEFTKPVIIHELAHAYYSYLCLESTTLTNSQLEEVWCDLIARFGPTIIRQSNQIFKEYKNEVSE